MESNIPLEEKTFRMGWKNFVLLQIGLLSFTNTANYLIFQQSQNTEQIIYNEDANKRRNKHLVKEFDYKLKIMTLETDIKNLHQEKVELAEDIVEWKVKYQELKETK